MEGDRILERVIRQAEITGRTGRRARQKQKEGEKDREGKFIVKYLFLPCFLFFLCVSGFEFSILNFIQHVRQCWWKRMHFTFLLLLRNSLIQVHTWTPTKSDIHTHTNTLISKFYSISRLICLNNCHTHTLSISLSFTVSLLHTHFWNELVSLFLCIISPGGSVSNWTGTEDKGLIIKASVVAGTAADSGNTENEFYWKSLSLDPVTVLHKARISLPLRQIYSQAVFPPLKTQKK